MKSDLSLFLEPDFDGRLVGRAIDPYAAIASPDPAVTHPFRFTQASLATFSNATLFWSQAESMAP